MKPGLETISVLCAALGDPQKRFPAVHVAGTNGKGAVCAILDAALRSAGLRSGRYTSPHLVKINERFFLDGKPAGDDTLDKYSGLVRNAISRICAPDPGAPTGEFHSAAVEPTFFEALTAVAFLLYADGEVDVAVIETGLGGRLDATNICSPALSVITRIGLDHCDWLGDTMEKIAAEKSGIIKPGVPVVLGANVPEVRAVVESRARELSAPFIYAPDIASESEIPSDFPLRGSFNRENAVTAVAALKTLSRSGIPVLRKTEDSNPAILHFPFSSLHCSPVWPGRYQRIGRFLVDGAHNPPAVRALVRSLAEEAGGLADLKFDLIAGFCADKDVDESLRILAPHVEKGFAVKTVNPRSIDAAGLARKMQAAGISATACDSLAAAIEHAGSRQDPDPRSPGLPSCLICGSLFLAGEAISALGAYPQSGDGKADPSESL